MFFISLELKFKSIVKFIEVLDKQKQRTDKKKARARKFLF